MGTVLIVQGGEIELADSETFNKARQRLNDAKKMLIDYENGNIDGETKGEKFEPFHKLSFKTASGGRVAVDPMKVIGVESDQIKDALGSSNDSGVNDEEEGEEEFEEDEEQEEEPDEEEDEEEEDDDEDDEEEEEEDEE